MFRLTNYFIKNQRVTNMVVLLIFAAGIYSALTLQREQFPALSFEVMKITTPFPGAAPEDVEINVTNRIEDQLKEVENIKKMTSMSMENISVIILQLDSESGDMEKTKNDIRDAVQRVSDLPDSIQENPLIEELKTSDMPVLELSISGSIPELELRKYARDLESRIKETSGVSSVSKIGYRKREVKINVNLNKMKEQAISFSQIMQAIRSRNVRSSGGTIESYVAEKNIVTLSEYSNPLDVKDVIIRSNYEGYQVKLSDIASISDDFRDPVVKYKGNGKPAISLIVAKQDGADIISLSNRLNEVIDEFKTIIPKSLQVHEIYDYSIFSRTMLDIVVNNGLFGFVLVLIVMFIFLDGRSAFWSAFGIPFSILGAMILFIPFGINLNLITLTSMILVLGIVVDDAIVISEKIYTLKQAGVSNIEATLQGVKLMAMPVTAAVLTTLLAFTPITFIPGVMGRFVETIPLVVTLILGLSLIESLLFIPSHIAGASPSPAPPRRIQWLEPVKDWYYRTILTALKYRARVLAGYMVLLLVITGISFGFMRFMLDEDIDQDFFAIIVETQQGTSLPKTMSKLPPIEELVSKNIPSDILKSYTTHIGHHDTDFFGASQGQHSNWAIINIFLIPASERKITSEKIISKLNPKIKKLKKELKFQRLEIIPLGGLETGKAVDIIFTSDNDKTRDRLMQEAVSFLNKTDGVQNIETSKIKGKEELRINLNYPRLAQTGLTAIDVAQTVRTAFDGTVVTSIRHEGEDIDFRVRINNPRQYREAGILNLPVANREGRLIPLKHVASITQHQGESVIRHYQGRRSIRITADINRKKTTSIKVNNLIREHFKEKIAGIPGLRMKFSGQEEETAESMGGFYFALVVVLISIYFLLVVLFNSYIQPALIMSVIPFAVAGSFLTLILHSRPLILISLIGMMGLIGIVVNDTIVMISHLNKKCREEGKSSETIASAALDRFRPVILTTLTTFAGLLPTAYGIGGDLPSIRPMVLTMAWGLVFSTIITLGFIPLLFSFMRVEKKSVK